MANLLEIGLRAKFFLKPDSLPQLEAALVDSLRRGMEAGPDESGIRAFTLADVYEGISLLREFRSSEEQIADYKRIAKQRWPKASRL